MTIRALLAVLFSIFFILPGAAGEHSGHGHDKHGHDKHDHDKHGHGAHAHGAANLSVLVDGRTLEIEMHAPGADIVGFEHAAKSDADRAAVAKALKILREDTTLFAPPNAAKCKITEAYAEFGKEAHGKADVSHREFEMRRIYTCEAPEKLDHVDVGLFQKFSSLKEIDAAVVGPKEQRGQELTPRDSRLRL